MKTSAPFALKFHQHLHLLINIATDFAPLCFSTHIIQNVAETIRPAFSLFEFLRLFDDGRQNLISHTLFELGSIKCQEKSASANQADYLKNLQGSPVPL